MSAKYTAGPDIDLDVEVVRDKLGERITEARATEIAAAALQKAGCRSCAPCSGWASARAANPAPTCHPGRQS